MRGERERMRITEGRHVGIHCTVLSTCLYACSFVMKFLYKQTKYITQLLRTLSVCLSVCLSLSLGPYLANAWPSNCSVPTPTLLPTAASILFLRYLHNPVTAGKKKKKKTIQWFNSTFMIKFKFQKGYQPSVLTSFFHCKAPHGRTLIFCMPHYFLPL